MDIKAPYSIIFCLYSLSSSRVPVYKHPRNFLRQNLLKFSAFVRFQPSTGDTHHPSSSSVIYPPPPGFVSSLGLVHISDSVEHKNMIGVQCHQIESIKSETRRTGVMPGQPDEDGVRVGSVDHLLKIFLAPSESFHLSPPFPRHTRRHTNHPTDGRTIGRSNTTQGWGA